METQQEQGATTLLDFALFHVTFGMVVVGWLGRGTTTLHCTHRALTHRLKVLSLFFFFSLVCLFIVWTLGINGSSSFCVLKKHLCGKYSGAVKDVSMRMWRNCTSYNLVSELADPQFTAVFAESQARGLSVTTLSKR